MWWEWLEFQTIHIRSIPINILNNNAYASKFSLVNESCCDLTSQINNISI